jgi:hypothetical protein
MKKQLIEGFRFYYTNENYCVENESDDIRGAEVHYTPGSFWYSGFKIYFNGCTHHMSKTYPSMQKKLNALIEKWHLELVKTEKE